MVRIEPRSYNDNHIKGYQHRPFDPNKLSMSRCERNIIYHRPSGTWNMLDTTNPAKNTRIS